MLYVRWGSTSCPDTGAELLYLSLAGGSHYNIQGGGGNPQCLYQMTQSTLIKQFLEHRGMDVCMDQSTKHETV